MIGIIILFLTNFLLGFSFLKIFFNKLTKLELLTLSQIFSLFLSPAIFMLLYLIIGFNYATYFLPIVILLIFGLTYKSKLSIVKEKISKKFLIVFVLLILLISAGFVNLAPFIRTADISFHLAIADIIKNEKTLPPDTVCLPGTQLHYPWFYHLTLALISIYSGISSFDIIPFFGIYLGILFLSATYLISKKYLKDRNLILLLILILGLFFLGPFVIVGPQGYALPFIATFFFFFISYVQDKNKISGLFSGLSAASLIYIHGLSFLFTVLVIISYLLYQISKLKLNLKEIYPLIVPLLIAMPYILFISEQTRSMFMFEPFAGIPLFLNYIKIYHILWIPIFLTIFKRQKIMDETQRFMFYCIITILFFVNLFVMPRSPNIERNLILMIFPLSLYSLKFMENLNQKWKFLFFVFTLMFFLLYPIDDLRKSFNKKQFIETNEYKISKWLKENSGDNERILAAPSPVYSAISQRKPVICEDGFLRGWFFEAEKIKENFEDLLILFKQPSQDLIKKYNITFTIIGEKEKEFFNKYDLQPFDFSIFPIVFESESVKVYKLSEEEVKNLPQTTNKTKIDLNYTSYSRWWEI